MPLYLKILLIWQITGGCILFLAWMLKYSSYNISNNILSPVWIYEEWNLNWFGTITTCFIFNLLCPVFSVTFWTCKLIKFVCTVGRDD